MQNQEAAAQNCSKVEQNANCAYAGQEFIETEAVAHACLLLLQCIILRGKKRFQNTYAGVSDPPSSFSRSRLDGLIIARVGCRQWYPSRN